MTGPPDAGDSSDVPSEEEVAADLGAAAAREPGSPEPGSPEPAAELRGPRRYPSTIGGAFYLAVIAASAIGLLIVATGDWRLGVRWLAGSLLAAAVVRLVLPERDAGMLKVRHRGTDVGLLVGCGVLLLFLATTIPNQPL